MTEYVAGWNDDANVYLVAREGEAVKCRRIPAKWSAFVRNLPERDRFTLQRHRDVVGIQPDGEYTRIDFRNKWARKEIVQGIQRAVAVGAMPSTCEVLEGDVNPLRRLLSDIGTIEIGTPRLGYFDLETDSRASFPDACEGLARVLSWSLYDDSAQLIAEDILRDQSIEEERRLLAGFFKAIEQFDCLLAWNGDNFDFPVLRNRIEKIALLVNGKPVLWERWNWLDQLAVFKKYNQAHDSGEERTSFRLDDVAQHLLGEGKHDFDASKTWQAWEAGGEERDRLLRYNSQDTKLLPRIEAKTGFVALHIAVAQVTRCFPGSRSLGAVEQGDGFLLRLGATHGYRFVTRADFDENAPRVQFEGAYVMEPKKIGALDDVHVCDFAGLYPSIMRTWNMSPDTLVDEKWTGPRCKLPDRNTHFRTDRRGMFPLALDQLVAQRAEYTKKADAAEPGSEDFNRYKRLSSAFKIIANSFYGIVGSVFGRYFDVRIAEGVTQTGAWMIKHTMSVLEAAGLDPVYGDTDSAFAQGKEESFGRVVTSLNSTWPTLFEGMGCSKSYVKLEFEKSFSRLLMISKKRYAGVFSKYKGKAVGADMKAEIKGLEYKRGDTIRLARSMQEGAIKMLLRPQLPTVTEMQDYTGTWRKRVLEDSLTMLDVKLSQSVKSLGEYRPRYTSKKCGGKIGSGRYAKDCVYEYSTTEFIGRDETVVQACPVCKSPRRVATQPAHVRVAKILRSRGAEITEGTRVEYVIAKQAADAKDETVHAIPANDPGALESIDRDYYWDKRVYPPTERLLAAVWPAIDWDDSAKKRRKGSKSGVVEDLALWIAAAAVPEMSPVVQSTRVDDEAFLRSMITVDVPPTTTYRRRRIVPLADDVAPQATQPITIHFDANKLGDNALAAVKAQLFAYPGPTPVTLKLRVDSSLVTMPTHCRVVPTLELRIALERLGATTEGFNS